MRPRGDALVTFARMRNRSGGFEPRFHGPRGIQF
jgi:hypothetical protein